MSNIQMLTHTWVEQYRNFPAGAELANAVRSSVQFNFGDAEEIPVARSEDFVEAHPPFNDCVLQFSTPSNKECSHLLVLWRSQPDESVHFMCSWKFRGLDDWRTTVPVEITRTKDGFHYQGGKHEASANAIQVAHAMTMNAFYILGCANVQTVDHDAPTALNKKRARTGKFPILTHKTLVIVAGAKRAVLDDKGGSHASPRVHLRRGHIRRLDEARRVWVQPCVVGSTHGMVTKDYQVTTTGRRFE